MSNKSNNRPATGTKTAPFCGQQMVSVVRVAGTAASGSYLTLELLQALQWYRDDYHPGACRNDASTCTSSGKSNTGTSTGTHQEEGGTAALSFPWQWSISNRYFSATIQLAGTTASPTNADATGTSTATSSTGSTNGTTKNNSTMMEDGVVLVFADDSPHDFDALASVHSQLVNQHDSGDLVRLCLGMGPTSSKQSLEQPQPQAHEEQEYARRILWCLDRGYEYIPGVNVSVTGRAMGHNVRDKDGFARVVEALQSTMWSTATKKTNIPALVATPAATPGSNIPSGSIKENCHHKSQLEQQNMVDEPPPITLLDEPQREEAAKKALLEGCNHPDEQCHEPNDNVTAQQPQHDPEQALGQLESALKEATRIRDLSQNGQLNDQERRQRAADAAMLLMNLMGMDEEDQDQDEEPDQDQQETMVEAAAPAVT